MAVAKETGVGTELGKIGATLRTIEPQRTPLQREIDRLVRVLAVFGVAAVVVVVVVYGLTRGNWLPGCSQVLRPRWRCCRRNFRWF